MNDFCFSVKQAYSYRQSAGPPPPLHFLLTTIDIDNAPLTLYLAYASLYIV